jgi:hypothetical protein
MIAPVACPSGCGPPDPDIQTSPHTDDSSQSGVYYMNGREEPALVFRFPLIADRDGSGRIFSATGSLSLGGGQRRGVKREGTFGHAWAG